MALSNFQVIAPPRFKASTDCMRIANPLRLMAEANSCQRQATVRNKHVRAGSAMSTEHSTCTCLQYSTVR
jgi:hypothetical protein